MCFKSRFRCAPLFVFSLGFLVLVGMGARPPIVGGPAPPFTLTDLDGRTVHLSDFSGQVVLLNFWATWCKPCQAEMPDIQRSFERLHDKGFVVLAVDFGEREEPVREFVKEHGLTFPVLFDPKVRVASTYGVVSLPVTFYIDRNGVVRERVFGGGLTLASIESAITPLLKESPGVVP